MRLLYPGIPYQWKQVDPVFEEEAKAASAAGLDISTFSFEDFGEGNLILFPQFFKHETVLYRGWMLTLEKYATLTDLILARGGQPLVTTEQYRFCHHLPNWYPLLREHTAETLVVPAGTDLEAALAGLEWTSYFVKDYVKSLSTGKGSVAKSSEEVQAVATELLKTRGQIEGGLCLRRVEDYVPASEERYFVVSGKVFSREGDEPLLVKECAAKIPSPFFSVDVAQNSLGGLRVIELGDGQVSDRKQWPVERFVPILEALAGLGAG